MPFFRLDEMKRHHLNPHLSSGEGPVIEGQYMYFRINIKRAGTGSEMHYHPNELMAFPITGKINCVVGKERQIVPPGTFVHVPSCARHSFRATEDGEVQYLYIKDRTWTLIGSAADESLPDEAPSATQVAKALKEGKWPGRDKEPQKSQAIVEGLGRCFYPMLETLDAPPASAHCEQWVEGANLAFGLIESPPGHERSSDASAHEVFIYVLQGALDAEVDGEKKRAVPGDLIHAPKNKPCRWQVAGKSNARYAIVGSTAKLEAEIESNGAADNWRG
ncbi:MAG: cupin domain-containing protein [Burkholderiales bacterium]|nr:cupin domain-containing protein [Burkholderiales bacterium]